MDDSDGAGSDPFQVILLATDGSEYSAGVERVGIEMASRHHAQLFILRLLLAEAGTDAAIVEEQDAALHLERVTLQCTEREISCTPMVRSCEEPSQGILAAAREVGAQLVILGRRGRRGLAKLMVGEATAKVVDKSECSVLVVPRLFSYWNGGVLLVAENDQDERSSAPQTAFSLARATQLPLTVLMVTEGDESERRELNQTVNRLVALAELQQVPVTGLVQSGETDDVILEVARQRSADIIVCEPRDRSVIDRLFQTNKLVHLIGRANCPVLVVHEAAVAS
ncbi:MAG: universal stress protein [Magnetococcales bacterium]|nr:universal stress protein [Magnetococcales bacterium]